MRRRRRTADVAPDLEAYLFDRPKPEGANPFLWLSLSHDHGSPDRPGRLRQAWDAHGEAVLAKWIAERPGTRPSTWWRFDAPEPRRKVGGRGEPRAMCATDRGIPTAWLEFDAHSPPRYEAEATYLRRHHLLEPGERERIPPSGFRPVEAPTPASAMEAA